jgi:DNA-binding transcriptional regulator GbsR (MarR family)
MDNKAQYYEEFGVYFEGIGLTRIEGRIIGLLLISPDGRLSMPEICEALKASKSNVSVALKSLTQLHLIDRISLPGERRDVFRASADMWTRSFRARMHQLTDLMRLAERGLELISDTPPEQQRRLRLMRDMNAFMAREFPKLLEAWDEEKKRLGYDDL